MPFVVFTDPALARVGLSEAEARARHKLVRILRFPFAENDLAQAERTPAGLIKVIVTAAAAILGAGVVRTRRRRADRAVVACDRQRARHRRDQVVPPPYPSRAEIARRVAIAFDGPGQTPIRRTGGIIAFLRKFG